MDEWDVVQGIFHKHLNCGENIRNALQWETSGHWSQAEGEYAAALSSSQGTFDDYCIERMYKVCSLCLILFSRNTVDWVLYLAVHYVSLYNCFFCVSMFFVLVLC
jgi:hypothetical protein